MRIRLIAAILVALVGALVVPGCRPESLKAEVLESRGVHLTWKAVQEPSDDAARLKTGSFVIYRQQEGLRMQVPRVIGRTAADKLFFFDLDARAGASYRYWVVGPGGRASNVATVKLPAPDFRLRVVRQEGLNVTFGWTYSGAPQAQSGSAAAVPFKLFQEQFSDGSRMPPQVMGTIPPASRTYTFSGWNVEWRSATRYWLVGAGGKRSNTVTVVTGEDPDEYVLKMDSGHFRPTPGLELDAIVAGRRPDERVHFLIQMFTAFTRTDVETLEGSGMLLVDSLNGHVVVLSSPVSAVGSLRTLPGVRWAGPMTPEMKIHQTVKIESRMPAWAQAPDAKVVLSVYMHQDVRPEDARAAVTRLGGSILQEVGIIHYYTVELARSQVTALAREDAAYFIDLANPYDTLEPE